MEIALIVLIVISCGLSLYTIIINKKGNNENVLDKVSIKYQHQIEDLNDRILKNIGENKNEIDRGFKDAILQNTKEFNSFKEEVNKRLLETEKSLRDSVDKNLEKINQRVEEKLTSGFKNTNETFNKVIERLTVIDEAQKKITSLSTEVVSLQDILNDKKNRGVFGEVQLNQILSNAFGEGNDIYEKQKKYSNGNIVDFAVRMADRNLWLSIDSKFPLENYKRISDNTLSDLERNNASKEFKTNIKKHIKDISSKYIEPGETFEQAIMFIPAESIFAEILAKHSDLVEFSQDNKVVLTSPTTLMALLKVIYFVDRDAKKSKATKYLFEQLKELGKDFEHYSERWVKLESEIRKVNDSVEKVSISSKKISNKFDKINSAKIQELTEGEEDN